MKRWIIFVFFVLSSLSSLIAQIPKPTIHQKQWHEMEFYLFVHFGPNTFTDVEWGHGDEDKNLFNPTALDCNQWCRTAISAGAKGIIITAKHHDGFCLWPSKYSSHTVAASTWRSGKGDVLKDLSQACKAHGLKFGIYISPWDRNHPTYGTEEYNNVFVKMMEELFDSYGPIWELWWDGANGEGPNGKKQIYDWNKFKSFVRKKSPSTVIFSDVGPDIRWVGNESGIAGTTNWNTLNTDGFTPGLGGPPAHVLNEGNRGGKEWIPAECDVSIRPGWFYHSAEDDKVKSDTTLFELYLKSVGRGSNLLLNVPPDRRGLFHYNDSMALVGFKNLIDLSFKYDLLAGVSAYIQDGKKIFQSSSITDADIESAEVMNQKKKRSININISNVVEMNCIAISENLDEGQGIAKWELKLFLHDRKIKSIKGTTIGRKRILNFPTAKVDSVTLNILESIGSPSISGISAYKINLGLTKL